MAQSRAWCLAALLLAACAPQGSDVTGTDLGRRPAILPDYTDLTIPPNIAPMNFHVAEDLADVGVRVTTGGGQRLDVDCADGSCLFDADDWRGLLTASVGDSLHFEVFGTDLQGQAVRFAPFGSRVAEEPMDDHIVYRQLFPNKRLSTIRGIFQRDVESFEREAIVTLRDGTFKCFNCHTFANNDPNKFLMHLRIKHAGTMLVMDGKIRKLNTKAGPMFRPMAFSDWHPAGRHFAATLNMYSSHFPATEGLFYFEAVEKRGDLVVYDTETNTVSSTRAVFENDYIETLPAWSHDGRYIYYSRGRDQPLLSEEDLDRFDFDMARIAYDVETDTWGEPEVVVAYSEQGKSCAFPRPSRDGRYVLHVVSDKGTYPIHQRSSELYIYDLETGQTRALMAANSELSESFPRWHSSGRWFSFTSNRYDGNSTLPHFAYFDTDGQAHKAFVLPQEDPTFYERFTDSYNVVEPVAGRVEVDPYELAQAMQLPAEDVHFPNAPAVDGYTGATWTVARMESLVDSVSRQAQKQGGDGESLQ